jgi:autocrine motility factor receptor
VLNLENLNEVIMWCTWFSIIGFLAIHCQICKDRFEYVSHVLKKSKYLIRLRLIYLFCLKLSFSANTPLKSHIKVLALLSFIQIKCIMLIVVSIMAAYNHQIGLSMSLFMFAESIGLTLRTVYILTK